MGIFMARRVIAAGSLVAAQLFALHGFAADAGTNVSETDQVANSVVKVFSTVRYPDPYKPWTKQGPSQIAGTGVVIAGKRILSNAHMVLYASQVEIQANQSGDRIPATVEYVAPGIDLAVLKLPDESFFNTHAAIPRAKTLPNVADTVMAYGFPTGGTGLSITKGIVSRIEFASYDRDLGGLRIQIDAAINPGNSGGPAMADGKMIGLVFSRLTTAENIGYIIPTEEIELFLADVASGSYRGKPALQDEYQTLENPSLRSFLKVPADAHGILVHRPGSTNGGYPLKEWDLVTQIGGAAVDDQGMVKLEGSQRVFLKYMAQKSAKDGKIHAHIIRAGKEQEVDVPVSIPEPMLLGDLEGSYPSYFICGPLAFSVGTTSFLSGNNSTRASSIAAIAYLAAAGSPLIKGLADKPAFEGQQLVVVSSPFFPHRLAKGYSDPAMEVVKSVNGTEVKNLKHLVEILRDSTSEFLTFEFDRRGGETMIFPRREMLDATDEILTDNGIRSQGSPDAMAVWNAKPLK